MEVKYPTGSNSGGVSLSSAGRFSVCLKREVISYADVEALYDTEEDIEVDVL